MNGAAADDAIELLCCATMPAESKQCSSLVLAIVTERNVDEAAVDGDSPVAASDLQAVEGR